jgi:hypothetical protein
MSLVSKNSQKANIFTQMILISVNNDKNLNDQLWRVSRSNAERVAVKPFDKSLDQGSCAVLSPFDSGQPGRNHAHELK